MTASLRTTVIQGTLWTVALRWLVRLIGLLNVAILARVLAPADFGLVAMAMLVVGLIETWMSFGVESALIQNPAPTRADYDTAWTIRAIQGFAIAALIVVLSPLAVAYFDEPRLGPLLAVLSLGVIVSGLSNIGVVMFRKELQFGKEFRTQIVSKLVSFPITIAAAFVLGNYWALAVGIVAAYTVACVTSYVMHPYRPRFSLERWRELWSFSQWLVVVNLIGYAERKSDEIVVGGYTSTSEMGLYSVASELGQMPSAELAAPVNRVLFPAFSKLQAEPGRLAAAYANALAMVATLALPTGVGLAVVAPHAVYVLLGAQWLASAPLLAALAFYGALRAVSSSAGYVLLAIGRPKLDAATACVSFTAFALGAAFAVVTGQGVFAIAAAKLASAFVSLVVAWSFLVRLTQVTIATIARSVIRPVLATAAMALVVSGVPATPFGAAADLVLKIVAGALAYVLALSLLWAVARCPEGPERTAIEFVKKMRSKKRAALA